MITMNSMFLFAVQRPDRPNQIQRRQEGRLQVGLAQTQDCKTHKGGCGGSYWFDDIAKNYYENIIRRLESGPRRMVL